MIAWVPFLQPMPLPESVILFLVLPLCYGVAVVYKTLRAYRVGQIPRQAGLLAAYMTGGLVALAAGLWLVQIWLF